MILNKIPAKLENEQVVYKLSLDSEPLLLNEFIGKKIKITFEHKLT